MPVLTEMSCLTPGAWSSVREHEMVVSDVLRSTVAVLITLRQSDVILIVSSWWVIKKKTEEEDSSRDEPMKGRPFR